MGLDTCVCVCVCVFGGRKDRAVLCLQGASRPLSRMERVSSGAACFCALRNPLASASGSQPLKPLPEFFLGAKLDVSLAAGAPLVWGGCVLAELELVWGFCPSSPG